MNRKPAGRWAALAIALAILMPNLAEAQTKVKSGYNMFSPEQDVEIGRQSAAEVQRQLPLVTNNSVEDYINQIGRKLAAQAPGPKFPYEFRVVNASDLNAFALPGGPTFVNRGIIEQAKNEGELAGVMAHEIAHVALRHGTANASKQYLTQAGIGILGGILGGKLGGNNQNTAQIINVLGGFGLNALFLKYSRQAETDADIVGSQIMAKAGYNPQDMANFFDTLAKADKRRVATWMSSHPQPENRMKRIQQEARLLGVTPQATQSTASLDRVKSSLRSLGAARTTAEIAQMSQPPATTSTGRSRGTTTRDTIQVEAPSRETRTYTNRAGLYQVQVPANWQVVDEGSSGVTFAPRGGAGELNGNTEVVYGAIINHYEPFGNTAQGNRLFGGSSTRTSATVEDATNDLVAQIVQSSPHLRAVRGSGRKLKVAGGNGAGLVLTGRNPNTGIDERVTVVTRQLVDDHLIYLLFITPASDAANYSGVLNTMLQTLRVDDQGRH